MSQCPQRANYSRLDKFLPMPLSIPQEKTKLSAPAKADADLLVAGAIAQAHGGNDADVDFHVRAFEAWRLDLAVHVASAA